MRPIDSRADSVNRKVADNGRNSCGDKTALTISSLSLSLSSASALPADGERAIFRLNRFIDIFKRITCRLARAGRSPAWLKGNRKDDDAAEVIDDDNEEEEAAEKTDSGAKRKKLMDRMLNGVLPTTMLTSGVMFTAKLLP